MDCICLYLTFGIGENFFIFESRFYQLGKGSTEPYKNLGIKKAPRQQVMGQGVNLYLLEHPLDV